MILLFIKYYEFMLGLISFIRIYVSNNEMITKSFM